MNCPICRQPTFVRKTLDAERRRECTGCKHRFTTVEKLKDQDQLQSEIIQDAKALAEKLQKAA